jgi:hypothetical protein
VSALITSCCLSFFLISVNGHLLPFLSIVSILGQRGCRQKTLRSLSGSLNSLPGPDGESLFASSALLILNLYLLKILMLCMAAARICSKLNLGGVGMLQCLPMTLIICSIKLIGKLKLGPGKLFQALMLCIAAAPVSSKLNLQGLLMLCVVDAPAGLKLNLQGLPMLIGLERRLSQVPLLEG